MLRWRSRDVKRPGGPRTPGPKEPNRVVQAAERRATCARASPRSGDRTASDHRCRRSPGGGRHSGCKAERRSRTPASLGPPDAGLLRASGFSSRRPVTVSVAACKSMLVWGVKRPTIYGARCGAVDRRSRRPGSAPRCGRATGRVGVGWLTIVERSRSDPRGSRGDRGAPAPGAARGPSRQ
jgi:hypothetical protein